MAEGKPHLLVRFSNNMGAESLITYRSSTQDYLRDKADGKPWPHRPAFPVHVVDRVEHRDWTTDTQYVSIYRYHDGCYDGNEREFCGFHYTESWDTERYEPFAEGGGFALAPVNADEGHHAQPVYTRSWAHTGLIDDTGLLATSDTRDGYLLGDATQPWPVPRSILPAGLSTEERRQAARALKGAPIRTEIYGLEGSDADVPYQIALQSHTIKRLQSGAPGADAVFQIIPEQSITIASERNLEDPRISHAITLKTDAYGHPTDEVAIDYPRRATSVVPEQGEVKAVYTHSDFAHIDDSTETRWLGVPFQSRSYEVNGLEWSWGSPPEWLSADQFSELMADPDEFRPNHETGPAEIAGSPTKRLLSWIRTYFRDDTASGDFDANGTAVGRLPLGNLDSLGLEYESYSAAMSETLAREALGEHFAPGLIDEGAYHREPGIEDLLWVPSGRVAYGEFLQPSAMRDPFGAVSTLFYDVAGLPRESVDPFQNRMTAENDFRVMKPAIVRDMHGDEVHTKFDTLGFPSVTALVGRDGEGDTLAVEDADGPPDLVGTVEIGDEGLADVVRWLGQATTRTIYDFDRYAETRVVQNGRETGEPPVVITLARERHVSDPGAGETPVIKQSFTYFDGMGRVAVQKLPAEPERESPDIPRWISSGRVVLNNKGNPVKQFEPFFSDTADYLETEAAREVGVSATLHYDALGRVIRTDLPDGTFVRTEFDPWRQEVWDAIDTVLESDWYQGLGAPDPTQNEPTDPNERAAWQCARHARTPPIQHLDVLGRPILSEADNGSHGIIRTRTRLDIAGNPLAVIDDRGNTVQEVRYDMAGRPIETNLMDAGRRVVFADIAGAPILSIDAKGNVFHTRYDIGRRPTHKFVRLPEGREILFERTVYGESFDPATAQANRLLGKPILVYDGAGLAEVTAFDFKGNPLRAVRRLARQYRETVDWIALSALEGVAEIRAAAEAELEPLLENTFEAETQYDALNRVIWARAPDGSITEPIYNEAGLLDGVNVTFSGDAGPTPFVRNIDYDEKGQRTLIVYGNGVTTEYTYDELNYRLRELLTKRPRLKPYKKQSCSTCPYFYDATGNITEITDDAQPTIFNANVALAARRRFFYDAISQLRQATGREHRGQMATPTDWRDSIGRAPPHANDAQAMRGYTQTYEYDSVGNILSMRHATSDADGHWTRQYSYAADSNRLLATAPRADPQADPFEPRYTYDEHGNMTTMPHLSFMRWSFLDQLQATSREIRNDGGTPETTYYVYGADGARIRKVTENSAAPGSAATRRAERIYVGGFEVYREFETDGETVELERQSLHVMDDSSRIALVETRTRGNDGSPRRLQRYQLSDHLGSAAYEVDETGATISYEEYHPYGTTAFKSGRSAAEVRLKRYRYTAMERDEETGLQLHGARYYATWLGRWTSADPIGIGDGVNLYVYVGANPPGLIDRTGNNASDPNDDEIMRAYTAQQKKDLKNPSLWQDAKPKSKGGRQGRRRRKVSKIICPRFKSARNPFILTKYIDTASNWLSSSSQAIDSAKTLGITGEAKPR